MASRALGSFVIWPSAVSAAWRTSLALSPRRATSALVTASRALGSSSVIAASASTARGRASDAAGTPSAESSNAACTPWAYQVSTGSVSPPVALAGKHEAIGALASIAASAQIRTDRRDRRANPVLPQQVFLVRFRSIFEREPPLQDLVSLVAPIVQMSATKRAELRSRESQEFRQQNANLEIIGHFRCGR